MDGEDVKNETRKPTFGNPYKNPGFSVGPMKDSGFNVGPKGRNRNDTDDELRPECPHAEEIFLVWKKALAISMMNGEKSTRSELRRLKMFVKQYEKMYGLCD